MWTRAIIESKPGSSTVDIGSPTTTPFRALLVDLDGTLYRNMPVRLAMAAELALGHWRALWILRQFRHEHERLRRELVEPVPCPFTLQIERTAARLGIHTTIVQSVVEHWMLRRPGKWLRRFARRELLERIARFRSAGGRTAIVSDYPAAQKLAALEARDVFDVVVASGEPGGPGRLKPFPDGLLAAADRLDVLPSECLVIGDRPEVDGSAAEHAGMAFLYVAANPPSVIDRTARGGPIEQPMAISQNSPELTSQKPGERVE